MKEYKFNQTVILQPMLHALLNDDDLLKYAPEWNLVEFLIKVETPLLKDVREHMKQYDSIPTVRFYNGKYI